MDIHTDQLLEQLTKRGVLAASWQTELHKVKNAFPEALALIPSEWADEVEAGCTLPGGTGTGAGTATAALGYWRCREMFAVLLRKKQEAGEASKTWLGSFKDPLLAKWDLILRAYRKRNVYVAESAAFLHATAGYEIPGLKGEVATSTARLAQVGRRARDTDAQIARQRGELEAFCVQRGITTSGNAPPTPASIVEDASRTTRADLPPLLAGLHEKIRDPAVARGVHLYRAFAAFMGGGPALAAAGSGGEGGEGGGDDEGDGDGNGDGFLPLLPTLLTFCEYDGPVASAAELPDLPLSLVGVAGEGGDGDGAAAADEIDWGGLDDAELAPGAGDDGGGAGEIDWDIGEEVAAAAELGAAGDGGSGGGGDGDAGMVDIAALAEAAGGGDGGGGDDVDAEAIDLGIEMEMDLGDFGIELGDGDAGGGGETAVVEHSLVDLPSREALSNDLLELQSFLGQRVREMAADTGNEYFTLTRDAPALIQKQTEASVQQLLDACNACVAALEGEELQRLLLLRDSKSAVRRLVDTVEAKRKRLEQLERRVAGFKSDARDLEANLGKQQLQLEEAVRTTKRVQALCEEALGELLREPGGVRIVGSVNTI